MRRTNRVKAIVMAACMGATLLAGCGNAGEAGQTGTAAAQAESKKDTSEHVVLTMYCIGDEGGVYAEEHLNKLNEVLTEKINAEIDPVMVSWGDYATKLPMVWASGEAYDLTYTSSWTNYFIEANKGAFMDITELFPVYAPLTYAEYEETGYLDTTKVNGKLYMIPSNALNYTTFVYNYREDLRKKYNCPEITDMETFETYLDTIKEHEPGMIPYANNGTEEFRYHTFLNEQDWSRPLEQANGVFVYDLKDPVKVFNVAETPEYEEFVKESREYYEKGYWSQSIMAETAASQELFTSGQSAIYLASIANSNAAYRNILFQHPDWEIDIFSSDLASGMTERIPVTNDGMAIGAYSKNPERALMFLELCYQDQEVYEIIQNGIEGVTFEKDHETMTKWTPEGANPDEIALKNLGMGIRTEKFDLDFKDDSPIVKELERQYAEVAVLPGLSGYAVNQDTITAELAALNSISSEYKIPLEKGVTDPEEGLIQLRQKLKDAKAEEVMEEINRQITEYLAEQG